MQILETCREMALACRESSRPLGLVATMGALHSGHLELVRRAREECAAVAASVFVNPAQFGAEEDLGRYPRDLARDLALLEAEGVDLVFVPAVAEIYPPGFDTWIEPGAVASRLEGAARPGHFRGVATVVAKLFNIVGPERAYFGQKDGQQIAVIGQLVRDLNLGVELAVVPTVRDGDGLALSSRNAYLTGEQRAAAPVLYRALRSAEELLAAGVRDGARLRAEVRRVLEGDRLVDGIDYVSVADAETLEEVADVTGRVMVSAAVWFGGTRLIDCVVVG